MNYTTGDILEYRCPKFGVVFQWRVISIHIGAERQESLIEVSPVMQSAGYSHSGKMPTTWVPEAMTRGLDVIKPLETTHDL